MNNETITKSNLARWSGPARGFTLMELLLSMTVLSLLLVLIVTLIRGTSDTVERTRRDMELGAVVRGLFDTIASDLAQKQPMADDDVALAFVPGVEGTRQDALALLVASRGFANEQWAESRLAAAWYGGALETLESGVAVPVLRRMTGPVHWEGKPGEDGRWVLKAMGEEIVTGVRTVTAAERGGTAANMGPGLVRLAIVIHIKDGEILPLGDANLVRDDDPPGLVLERNEIVAFTVGVAMVGERALADFVGGGGSLASLVQTLPAPSRGRLPLESWDITENPSVGEALANLDRRIAREIRFYQQTFPLVP